MSKFQWFLYCLSQVCVGDTSLSLIGLCPSFSGFCIVFHRPIFTCCGFCTVFSRSMSHFQWFLCCLSQACFQMSAMSILSFTGLCPGFSGYRPVSKCQLFLCCLSQIYAKISLVSVLFCTGLCPSFSKFYIVNHRPVSKCQLFLKLSFIESLSRYRWFLYCLLHACVQVSVVSVLSFTGLCPSFSAFCILCPSFSGFCIVLHRPVSKWQLFLYCLSQTCVQVSFVSILSFTDLCPKFQ